LRQFVAQRLIGFFNVCRAMGYFSARSLPMPTACEPWPGKMNAIMDVARLGMSLDSGIILIGATS